MRARRREHLHHSLDDDFLICAWLPRGTEARERLVIIGQTQAIGFELRFGSAGDLPNLAGQGLGVVLKLPGDVLRVQRGHEE